MGGTFWDLGAFLQTGAKGIGQAKAVTVTTVSLHCFEHHQVTWHASFLCCAFLEARGPLLMGCSCKKKEPKGIRYWATQGSEINLDNLIHFGGEKTPTPVHDPKSSDMDSVQVGKAVFKKIHVKGSAGCVYPCLLLPALVELNDPFQRRSCLLQLLSHCFAKSR